MVVGRGNFARLILLPTPRYLSHMDCEAYKRIPNALKEHRVRCGLWQRDVAARLGLKDTAPLSRWENGDSLPNLVSAIRLSAIYQVPMEDLFPELAKLVRGETETTHP